MAVPKQHDSKSKVGRRRSQKKLKKQNVMACSNCSAPSLPHRACSFCGHYKKKDVTTSSSANTKPEVDNNKTENTKEVEEKVTEAKNSGESKKEKEEEVKS